MAGVREPSAQVHQGDQHPVGEDQVVLRSGASLPLPLGATPLVLSRLAPGKPRVCQLLDQIAEM
ncbi:hypothetical protein ACIQWL_55060 [Streptomyces mirabilis]|uniref:hypothetical protein n=1 Tax=Streptomyces mirabilis TaxID=68239 RepID=UPI002E1F9C03